MAVKTVSRRVSRKTPPQSQNRWQSLLIRYLPAWIALTLAMAVLTPRAVTLTLDATGHLLSQVPRMISNLFNGSSSIAPLFTEQVQYWGGDIDRWASEHDLDPNLLATVMQIESCGHPAISSYAGAQGLFQVMPFHFGTGENQLDPDTNAKRGADFLKICAMDANGDAGLALACYNGGQSIFSQPFAAWQDQTQRYYRWGSGIYADAVNNQSHSDTLDQWLAAGGSNLCDRAEAALGL